MWSLDLWKEQSGRLKPLISTPTYVPLACLLAATTECSQSHSTAPCPGLDGEWYTQGSVGGNAMGARREEPKGTPGKKTKRRDTV